MLEIGERTGCLDTMLENVAAYCEEECEVKIGLLKRVVEPTLLLVLGVVIGILVLAMYLPIFSMGEMLG